MNGTPPHEGVATEMPPMAPEFETLEEMYEALGEVPTTICFVERVLPKELDGQRIAGLISVTDATPTSDDIRDVHGGGAYVVYVTTPEAPAGQWFGVCYIGLEGEPNVISPSIVLPPGIPMEVIHLPAAGDVLRMMFAPQTGGTYEEVPSDIPFGPVDPAPQIPPMPGEEAQGRCQPRSTMAPGMALGAAMTAYGAGAFVSDMVKMFDNIGHGVGPALGQIIQSAMRNGSFSSVNPGMAVPDPMPPMPNMPNMPWGFPEQPQDTPEPDASEVDEERPDEPQAPDEPSEDLS